MTKNISRTHYDVIIIGAGPAGSTAATYLTLAGLSVLIIEKETFPRYHVGESLTGMAAEIIHEFGLAEEMDTHQFPPKGGVKIIGSGARSEFFVPVLQPTWQVRRDEFDTILLENSARYGAELVLGEVKEILQENGRVTGVRYLPKGHSNNDTREVFSEFLVDASGRAALMSRAGIAGKVTYFDEFSRQAAVFTQFKGALRDPGDMGDNTFIFYSEVYHWAWFIPLSPDVVSIGIVVPTDKLKALGGPEAVMEWGLQNINPDLARRVESADRLEEIRAITNYSYAVDPFVGDGWLAVGDAHRFADPIFSFGASFAMVEARAASQAILEAIKTGDSSQPFADYAEFADRGQNAALDVIRYFWKYPVFFGFQSRGKLRKDIRRLLSSDVHSPYELKALTLMRNTLKKYEAQPVAV